jgi:hypothetical protein
LGLLELSTGHECSLLLHAMAFYNAIVRVLSRVLAEHSVSKNISDVVNDVHSLDMYLE